jgi:putative Ca2+/H+ antiporter (TMEM165/GDT1 family)
MDSFLQSFGAILVSEIGDKTFFIAALLAMKSSPHVVFAGAIGALAFMTVLSVVLGYAAPLLLPREITHYAAVALFFFFGFACPPNRATFNRCSVLWPNRTSAVPHAAAPQR